MFFKLQKYFTIFKKLFLTETEMQILAETQIPRDLTLRPMLNAILYFETYIQGRAEKFRAPPQLPGFTDPGPKVGS